ncbi:MAG: DmsE family decaheme c-type cytochrome [Acidobacteria bacterium]|nr:DmsE family decaheme c-type cytochrome [Acidobacteriota bacterium]
MSTKRSKLKLAVLLVFFVSIGVVCRADLSKAASLMARTGRQNQAQSNKANADNKVRLELPKELRAPAAAADYVGTDTCKACHVEQFDQFAVTAHYVTMTSSKYPDTQKGCEMCHGPGKTHVDAGGGTGSILNPKNSKATEVAAMCATCHQDESGRQNFHQNQHDIATVSCNDCHSPHQPHKKEFMLISDTQELCISCHREVSRDFAKPFHHKVPEGGMSCNDCHQQHGLLNKTQTIDLAGGMDAMCLRCHTDKQGPFVFEHMSARSEGCITCHNPHGSINNRMLVRSDMKMLCMQCHSDRQGSAADDPQKAHDLRDPRYQNCTSCHIMIHGSNSSRLLLH